MTWVTRYARIQDDQATSKPVRILRGDASPKGQYSGATNVVVGGRVVTPLGTVLPE